MLTGQNSDRAAADFSTYIADVLSAFGHLWCSNDTCAACRWSSDSWHVEDDMVKLALRGMVRSRQMSLCNTLVAAKYCEPSIVHQIAVDPSLVLLPVHTQAGSQQLNHLQPM